MSVSQPFQLSVDDRVLDGVLDFPGRDEPRPVVVVCHGFKAFYEWGFYPPLAELLTSRGFVVVRFNFSGAGMRPGDDLVTDLEAFRQATFSRDVEEARAVLSAVGELAPGRIDPERISLLGHSRGGGVALLAAAAEDSKVRTLVTWASVATFDRMDDATNALWRREGELPLVNARTGQDLRVGVEVLEDLERNRERLDLLEAATRRTAPWLIIHGTEDETVPFEEAERLSAAARAPSELLTIEGGSHTFGAGHPFDHPTPQLIETLNATQIWLRRHLGD